MIKARQFTRKEIVKQIKEYLDRNRIYLESVDFLPARYRPTVFCSDGSLISEAESDTELIIKFRPKRTVKRDA